MIGGRRRRVRERGRRKIVGGWESGKRKKMFGGFK